MTWNLYFTDDSKNILYLQKPSVFLRHNFFNAIPHLNSKNVFATLFQKDAVDGGNVIYLKNSFSPPKHLKIKYLCHSTGRNSAAIIRIELPSVSNIAFIVALFPSFINWAFWFPWKPNCRHGLLRSSVCCTKHKELWVCYRVTSFLAVTGSGNLSTFSSGPPSWFSAWRILMDFPYLS